MTDRVQRELLLPGAPQDVWNVVTSPSWLADDVRLDLRPGGDASFRSGAAVKIGWVEEVCAPVRLAFWWAADGEPATRVELTLESDRGATRLLVVESRPLERLELVATPLPRVGGSSFGPALVAA
ncbi:MAG: SRPBCC family protein [Solirubrobacteraceae bacterium]